MRVIRKAFDSAFVVSGYTPTLALACALATLAAPGRSQAAGADLAVTEVALAASSPSAATAVRVAIRNLGTSPTGASRGRLLASADPQADPSDPSVAVFEVPPLGAGAVAAVLLRPVLPAGSLYLIGIADAENTETESDELNNIRAVQRTASDPFDTPGVLRVCSTCPHTSLSAAVAAVRDGETILIHPAASPMQDCAVISRNDVTIRGVLDPQGRRPVLGHKSCAGKGVVVLQDPTLRNLAVEGLEIVGAKVPDGNGAAVRFQGQGLTLRNVFLHDNENGVLTSQGGSAGAGTIRVEHSIFLRNGSPTRPGMQHNVYVAGAAGTTLDFSGNISLAAAHEGHELKTRAERSSISCSVVAGLDGVDSYTIDMPQAGDVTVRDNVLQQGPQTSNKAMFSFGRESSLHVMRELRFRRNIIVDDKPGGYFFALGPGSQLSLEGDTMIGGGAVVNTGAEPVSNTSTRHASRAAYRAATSASLLDWSAAAPSLPDLPAGCPRLYPQRLPSFDAYLRELTTTPPRAPDDVLVR